MNSIHISLKREFFSESSCILAYSNNFKVTGFRYASGVEALLIENNRGSLTVLPFMGQMIWDATFDGVKLGMGSRFQMPRAASTIIETYGCFAYHSGLLRNGCPSPADTHPLHGEMPCAPMDSAYLVFGTDERGEYIQLQGRYEYIMGFGAHYQATPSITLHAEETFFDVVMEVENLSSAPMELMYMYHANFAFVENGRFIQPVSFTPDHVVVRRTVPGHVIPGPKYLPFMEKLAADPSMMETLDQPDLYDPEQVFYIKGLPTDQLGLTHTMLKRPEGDAFALSYSPEIFPTTVRWVLNNGDIQVSSPALPSTCEPEGYLAEKAKNNVLLLASGDTMRFPVRLGYLDAAAASVFEKKIKNL